MAVFARKSTALAVELNFGFLCIYLYLGMPGSCLDHSPVEPVGWSVAEPSLPVTEPVVGHCQPAEAALDH